MAREGCSELCYSKFKPKPIGAELFGQAWHVESQRVFHLHRKAGYYKTDYLRSTTASGHTPRLSLSGSHPRLERTSSTARLQVCSG